MDGAKRRVLLVLALVGLTIHMDDARADQVFLITEYACHTKEGIFILATHAFDSENGDTDSTPGFHKVGYGVAHISCKVGSHWLRALIDVSSHPLQAGAAEGETTVTRMSVDGISLFDHRPTFYWLTGDRPLLEIRVKVSADGLLIDSCTAKDPVYGNVSRPDATCESTVRELK